ncbi:MAG: 1-acyl-sn-glycerol-3-phosphate acyltransferase, partial [Candidatus Omnitrophica bacterium]|nr:1-acyl-sn-glycerol-3-phosphate acyltransferase [Candidatus Omnitrophota bacterium]
DRGYSLFVFPEGRRTKNGKINIFQTGTGFLALNMNAKIVPVKIKGLFEILPISKFWPRVGRVSITFGKPIEIKNVSYIEATKIIEEKVKGLG